MKRVLILGESSYIARSFREYVQTENIDIKIVSASARNEAWKQVDFRQYDTVLHLAGIAHADIGSVSKDRQQEYYAVNRDLPVEAAKAAKAAGVRQFIYPSSIIIYGDSAPYGKKKRTTADTVPVPSNFYGDSKWQAEQRLQELGGKDFQIAIVRLPMIYGKGSKGNYPLLAKLAKTLPFFPKVQNQRSMLYIENLCEFLTQLIHYGDGGIFYPQNREYTTTSAMVEDIAQAAGKKIRLLSVFTPCIWAAAKMPGKIAKLTNKAFGNCIYDKELSKYRDNSYQKYSLAESIQRTERR